MKTKVALFSFHLIYRKPIKMMLLQYYYVWAGPARAVEEHPPTNPAIWVQNRGEKFFVGDNINLHLGTTLNLRTVMFSSTKQCKVDFHSFHYVKGNVAR